MSTYVSRLGPLWGISLWGGRSFWLFKPEPSPRSASPSENSWGHFFPSVAASHWLIGPFHVGVWQPFGIALGGNGYGAQHPEPVGNYRRKSVLTILNTFGLKTGRTRTKMCSPLPRVSALAALVFAGILVGRNAHAGGR